MTIDQLHKIYLEHPVIYTDSRKVYGPGVFVALKGPQFDGNLYAEIALEKGASVAIIDDILLQCDDDRLIYVTDALETLQNLASYHRTTFDIPVIALTGSNGKTTTKELLKSVLSQKYNVWATPGNFNNHIGVPLTLLGLTDDHEMAIVEMGASALNEIAFLAELASPTEGLITNIGLAHVEGFGGVENILIGKTELYDYLKKNKALIYAHAADEQLMERVGNYTDYFAYSISDIAYTATKHIAVNAVYGELVSVIVQEPDTSQVFRINSNLYGAYNALNILAAVAVGFNNGLSIKQIKDGIESYVPVNNRSQLVQFKKHKIILDAYNANPTSMKLALASISELPGTKGVVVGAMKELGEESYKYHLEIINCINSLGFTHCAFIGKEYPLNDIGKVYTDYKEALNENIWKEFDHVETILLKGSRSEKLELLLESDSD